MLIVVEGNTDKDFIRLYFNFLKASNKILSNTEITFVTTGGKYNIKNEPRINEEFEKGERVLIIFDKDDEQSLQNIHKQLDLLDASLKYKCEIFLIPNNQDIGNLEILLEKIAKEKCILKCFDAYEKCIKEVQSVNSAIKLPAKKSKVFAYLSSFGFKNGNNNFHLDESMLDLQSPYLENLKNFLIGKMTQVS